MARSEQDIVRRSYNVVFKQTSRLRTDLTYLLTAACNFPASFCQLLDTLAFNLYLQIKMIRTTDPQLGVKYSEVSVSQWSHMISADRNAQNQHLFNNFFLQKT